MIGYVGAEQVINACINLITMYAEQFGGPSDILPGLSIWYRGIDYNSSIWRPNYVESVDKMLLAGVYIDLASKGTVGDNENTPSKIGYYFSITWQKNIQLMKNFLTFSITRFNT